MTTPTPKPTADVIELVKKLNERKPKGWQWGDEVAEHFDTITEALIIAVKALEQHQCHEGCYAGDRDCPAKEALSKIHSLHTP